MQHRSGPYNRFIVITDEQINRALPPVPCEQKYVLNVAAYQHGIGTQGGWLTISGFSEASIDYIMELEGNVDEQSHDTGDAGIQSDL
jgi:hypothetical protein